LIAGILAFGRDIVWKAVGGSALGIFVLYLASVGWAISKGSLIAPEISDDDDDSGRDEPQRNPSSEAAQQRPVLDESVNEQAALEPQPEALRSAMPSTSDGEPPTHANLSVEEAAGLSSASSTDRPASSHAKVHSFTYHVAHLIFGFLCLVLGAYVLSHSASSLIDQFHISDVLFGIIILSIATTLPEKFVAVLNGWKGQMGVMVANG
jgi:hypothetical protein